MRILYHHRTQGRGAEGNHIVSIVTALRALGHEVDVASPPGVDPFDPASTIPVDKAKTETRGWSSVWKWMSRKLPNWLFELAELGYNIPAYFRLRKLLRTGKYDLLFERYAFFLVAGARAARRCGVPFLLEVNEVSGIPNRARRQTFQRLCAATERYIFRRCTVVHAVSSWLGHGIAVSAKHYLQIPAELYERAAALPSRSALQNALQHRTARGRTKPLLALASNPAQSDHAA